jgi:membrane-bound serine protease (ClpP class)
MPVNLELENLRGRFGRAVSALRPAGVVDFDGRRVDTITEGLMVEPGQWVRCIDVRAGKVIVRPVERPDLGDLETAVFQ